MLKYAEMFCKVGDAEDIVQRVLVKLVEILRDGRYERRKGAPFKTYLKRLIKNEFLDWRRSESSRGDGLKIPLSESSLASGVTPPDIIDLLDRYGNIAGAREGFQMNSISRKDFGFSAQWAQTRGQKMADGIMSGRNCSCPKTNLAPQAAKSASSAPPAKQSFFKFKLPRMARIRGGVPVSPGRSGGVSGMWIPMQSPYLL